ncbi:MAG: PilZ domain-containing protein, partial [Firmicutes bacterium]|nr:PilZ domain-containing protein [Bacillota bacterium]
DGNEPHLEPASYESLTRTRRLVPGASLRITRTDDTPIHSQIDVANPARGELVAAMSREIALRLWDPVPGVNRGDRVFLRVGLESDGSFFMADVGPADIPSRGEIFWADVPSEWTRVDRRRSYRLEIDIAVEIRTDGTSLPVLRRMLDLSLNGCRVEAISSPIGSRVRLRFGIEPVASELDVAGRVVRTSGVGASSWSAIQFDELPAPDAERLRRFLFDRERSLLMTRLPHTGRE